jgi:glyoxylase-like metal-dependent hydrolase (beta-lactamase superfamily II)
MIVHRSMHPDYRSNAYLVADEPGGHAVFIDAGAPVEPLMAKVAELDVKVTHVLLTHEHHDHTTHAIPLEERYGAVLVSPEGALESQGEIRSGGLLLRALSTPGHCSPHVAWAVEQDGDLVGVFTGDVLFRGTVGGTLNGGSDGFAKLRASILETLLTLPTDTTLYPGHMDETSVGEEASSNPFVLAWRGETEPGSEQVQVAGNDATLLLMAPDYDGGTKAWVRFTDGNEAVVGGSMVSRAGARA